MAYYYAVPGPKQLRKKEPWTEVQGSFLKHFNENTIESIFTRTEAFLLDGNISAKCPTLFKKRFAHYNVNLLYDHLPR